jgi:rubredoxin
MITCPACGYTFRNENLRLRKNQIICPMCRYQFKDPNIPQDKLDEFII